MAGDSNHFDQFSGETLISPNANDLQDQIIFNEAYSELLKTYLRVLPGMDPRESSFSCFMPEVSTLNSSHASVYTKGYEHNDGIRSLDDHDYSFRDTLGLHNISGPVPYKGIDYSSTAEFAKKILKDRMLEIIGEASPTISSSALSKIAVETMSSIIFGGDKYRDQIICPRVFERVFCLCVDPEDDFIAYVGATTSAGDTEGDLVIASDYVSPMYNFFIQVQLYPKTGGDTTSHEDYIGYEAHDDGADKQNPWGVTDEGHTYIFDTFNDGGG